MLCSANNFKIREEILINTFKANLKNIPKWLWLLVCLDQRVSTLLESQHEKHTEKVRIFTLEKVEELDFPRFPISSENLTFKAQICLLWLNLKWGFVSLSYNIIRANVLFQIPCPESVDPEQPQTPGSHSLPPRLAEDLGPRHRIHLGYKVTLAQGPLNMGYLDWLIGPKCILTYNERLSEIDHLSQSKN